MIEIKRCEVSHSAVSGVSYWSWGVIRNLRKLSEGFILVETLSESLSFVYATVTTGYKKASLPSSGRTEGMLFIATKKKSSLISDQLFEINSLLAEMKAIWFQLVT